MNLYDMDLGNVLKGLKFVKHGYFSKVIGNDNEKTEYIKNLSYADFKLLVNFNLDNLNKGILELSYKEYKTAQRIKTYIIPKLEKAKNRFKKYGF